MSAFMWVFGVLTMIGGMSSGIALMGEPLTRTMGIAAFFGGFVSGMLFFAVARILNRLDEIQVMVGRPSRSR